MHRPHGLVGQDVCLTTQAGSQKVLGSIPSEDILLQLFVPTFTTSPAGRKQLTCWLQGVSRMRWLCSLGTCPCRTPGTAPAQCNRVVVRSLNIPFRHSALPDCGGPYKLQSTLRIPCPPGFACTSRPSSPCPSWAVCTCPFSRCSSAVGHPTRRGTHSCGVGASRRQGLQTGQERRKGGVRMVEGRGGRPPHRPRSRHTGRQAGTHPATGTADRTITVTGTHPMHPFGRATCVAASRPPRAERAWRRPLARWQQHAAHAHGPWAAGSSPCPTYS